jgi:hypothetical protein
LLFIDDDGIVVVRSERRSPMESTIRAWGETWKEEVLSIAGERFERRLSEEFATFRVEMAKEFAAVRGEMAKEFAAVRVETAKDLAATRADLLKWSFIFWIGQFAAVSGMMAFLLRTLAPR